MNSELERAGRQIACPFCNSTETEMIALFGQFLLASQYYCRSCRTAFDVVRWQDEQGQANDTPENRRPSG